MSLPESLGAFLAQSRKLQQERFTAAFPAL